MPQWSGSTDVNRWCKRIILVVTSTVFGLLAGEGIVRILGVGNVTFTRGSLHAYDPDAGWTCQPDADTFYSQPGSFNVRVLCNSRGLRDEEIPYEKPPDRIRIVCLGDSFMWGYGVENNEMFSSRLEELIPGCETVNLGANGYSTVQEMIRLETEGLKYGPNWTVLLFCWNDLEDNFCDKGGGRPVARLSGDGELEIINRPVRKQWKSPFKQWLRHHSKLFRLGEYWTARYRLHQRNKSHEKQVSEEYRSDPVTRSQKVVPDSHEAVLPSTTPSRIQDQEKEVLDMRLSFFDIFGAPDKAVNLAWQVEELALSRIHRMVSDTDGRLLVVYVASQLTMKRKSFDKYMASLDSKADLSALDWDRPPERLGKICSRLGIPYLNLMPLFREHEQGQSLFLKNNGHWSAAGHDLAARAVADTITSLMVER